MKKNLLKLAILCSMLFIASSVEAEDSFTLEVIKECDIKYSGNSCIIGMEIVNTGNEKIGNIMLHTDYAGVCSDNVKRPFDGAGIWVAHNGILSSAWANGNSTLIGLNFLSGTTQTELEIKTHPALCPGQYDFSIMFEVESGEQVVGGGGGGGGGGISLPTTTTPEPDLEKEELLKEIIRLMKLIIEVLQKLIRLKQI